MNSLFEKDMDSINPHRSHQVFQAVKPGTTMKEQGSGVGDWPGIDRQREEIQASASATTILCSRSILNHG